MDASIDDVKVLNEIADASCHGVRHFQQLLQQQ